MCTSVIAFLSQLEEACNFPSMHWSTVLTIFLILDKVIADSLILLQDTLIEHFHDRHILLVQPKIH